MRTDLPRKPRTAALAAAALFAVGLLVAVAGAQVRFDATVATVNGELITRSDLLWNLALDPNAAPADFWKPATQELMLRTVVGQRLLLQEAAKLPAAGVTEQEVTDEIARITAQFSPSDDPNRFTQRLQLVGLTQDRLRRIARDRVQIEKFVEFRFRSFVVVTEEDIRRYYETELVPVLRERGQVPPAEIPEQYRDDIREILSREKVNEAIDAYLEDARARAEIVVTE